MIPLKLQQFNYIHGVPSWVCRGSLYLEIDQIHPSISNNRGEWSEGQNIQTEPLNSSSKMQNSGF